MYFGEPCSLHGSLFGYTRYSVIIHSVLHFGKLLYIRHVVIYLIISVNGFCFGKLLKNID